MSTRSLPELSQPSFGWPVRVYIEDTDAGGVVFYANYLRYLERARTEYIRSLGFPRVIVLEEGLNYVVHSLSIQYRKPAVLDDQLYVTADVVELGKTWMKFSQQVFREPVRGFWFLQRSKWPALTPRLCDRGGCLQNSLLHSIRALPGREQADRFRKYRTCIEESGGHLRIVA